MHMLMKSNIGQILIKTNTLSSYPTWPYQNLGGELGYESRCLKEFNFQG